MHGQLLTTNSALTERTHLMDSMLQVMALRQHVWPRQNTTQHQDHELGKTKSENENELAGFVGAGKG